MAEYMTIQGDTFEKIAWEQMGSSFKMMELINANKAYFETVEFPAGITLTIPEDTETAEESIPPWRR